MAQRLPEDAHAPFLEPGDLLTAQKLAGQERKFLDLLAELMERAEEHGVTIRTIGSIAFRVRCPDYKKLEYDNGRYLTDVDFMAYSREIAGVQDMFDGMGWEENMTVLRLFGDKRRIFYHPELPIHSDIFLDRLRFCHEIDFRGRLELDSPTIPLIDLLLEKLQIVEINRKDLVDVMVLLSQYDIAEEEGATDSINGARLARLCGRDWGWWRTATMNLDKTRDFAAEYLSEEHAPAVRRKVDRLREMIDSRRKGLRWKLRSMVGERLRWYREVEEVERD